MNHRNNIAARLGSVLGLLLAANGWSQEATVYHGFTRLDPTSATVTENAFVVVQGDRIARVGSGAPPRNDDWNYVDMSGRYALPGFFDTHAHVTIGPLKVEVKDGAPTFRFEVIHDLHRHNALIALAYGVTTIRNPAGDAEANAHYDEMIESGAWLGPEAVHAGDLFNPGFPHYPRNDAEWEREMTRQRDLGMTYAKLYSGLTEQELARGIEVAHAHGLKTIAHLDTVSWTRAMELGIDELTHALPTSADLLVEPNRSEYVASRAVPDAKFMYRWFELVDYDSAPFQNMLRMLVEKKIHVDLTLVTSEIVYFYDRDRRIRAPPARARLSGSGLPRELAAKHDRLALRLERGRLPARPRSDAEGARAREALPRQPAFVYPSAPTAPAAARTSYASSRCTFRPAFRRGKCCGSPRAARPSGSGWRIAREPSRRDSKPTSCF